MVGPARRAGDRVLHPQLGPHDGAAQGSFPLQRTRHLVQPTHVKPAGPRGLRARQPDRPDDQQRDEEHADQPVHTLPLSTTSTASGNVSTIAKTTPARSGTEWVVSCHRLMKNKNGCRPRTSSPPTATAAKTASTEVRPSSSQ